MALPIAQLKENNVESRRASAGKRAFPLGEPGRPSRPGGDLRGEVRTIIDWLNVPISPRYSPDTATYCNIYAADFCYLAGVYLPRVWWTTQALKKLKLGATVATVYGDTVAEMRADDLYAWLSEFGPSFGWSRVNDASSLQTCANAGGIGIVCADRAAPGLPGHISVVVAETEHVQAVRSPGGAVLVPVQSQAGARNFKESSGTGAWWADARFQGYGFWTHG